MAGVSVDMGDERDTTNAVEARLSSDELGELFDEAYYQSGCGDVSYSRTEPRWAHFFGTIADNLIRAVHPQTVLDAGCALGFLVEAFWDRGVRARGIDVSRYAIANVRRDMQPYCQLGSIADGIDGTYDLITCVEVLEHMPPDQADRAIGHLTGATDVILFSSTPFDLEEPTHFNVRPLVSWLEAFQSFGFSPDLEFDASFVASHAMLLRRKEHPFSMDVLRTYASLLRFRHDVTHLQARVAALQKSSQEQSARGAAALEQSVAVRGDAAAESHLQDVAGAVTRATDVEERCQRIAEQLQPMTDRIEVAEQHISALASHLHASVKSVSEAADETGTLIGKLDGLPDLREMSRRIEHLESTVTGSCIPMAELFPAERLFAIEKMAYEASNPGRLPSTPAQFQDLDSRLRKLHDLVAQTNTSMQGLHTRVAETEAKAIEARHNSNAILNSRIWKVLVRASSVFAGSRG